MAGGCPAGRGVAVAARAGAGYSGSGVAELYTLADAAAFGTESVLYGMAQTLLAAGIVPVYAAAAGEDYAAALAALETEENLFAVVCDGGAEALCAHVDACCAAGRERVGLLAVAGTEAARETAAAADNRRVAVLCDGGTNTARTAAAFAAALAAANAGSLSGLAVPLDIPFDGGLTAAETEELLRAGVTPFERCGGEVRCVRALTTSRTVNGLPDNTFSALSTVLAVDEVVGAVRRAVRSAGCTAQKQRRHAGEHRVADHRRARAGARARRDRQLPAAPGRRPPGRRVRLRGDAVAAGRARDQPDRDRGRHRGLERKEDKMAFISFPTSKDIYIEVDGRRLATAQSYKAKSTRESRYVEAFGSAEPVGTVGGRIRHVLELVRVVVSPASDVDFFSLEDFNVVIVRPDGKIIYSGCQWSAIGEDAPLGDLVYESLTLVARSRMEVPVMRRGAAERFTVPFEGRGVHFCRQNAAQRLPTVSAPAR